MTFEQWWKENGKRCRGWKYKKTAHMAFEAGYRAGYAVEYKPIRTGVLQCLNDK